MTKQQSNKKPAKKSDDLDREYSFDYSQAKPNRFARQTRVHPVVVALAPDVAKVFKDAKSVNAVLRSIVRALRKP